MLEEGQILLIAAIMAIIAMGMLFAETIIQKLKGNTGKIGYLLLIGSAGIFLGISSLMFFYKASLMPVYVSAIGTPAALIAVMIIITILMIRKKQTS